MIQDAQIQGSVRTRKELVEPTSGNTGLGLTMVSNANGYRLTTPLSSAIPEEKRNLLRFFGAEVVRLNSASSSSTSGASSSSAIAVRYSTSSVGPVEGLRIRSARTDRRRAPERNPPGDKCFPGFDNGSATSPGMIGGDVSAWLGERVSESKGGGTPAGG